MIEIHKQSNKPIAIVRTATGNELSDYEKKKLASVEEGAQKNKIEAVCLNNKRLYIDPVKKELNLGNYAFKNKITSADLDSDEFFFISCELSESESDLGWLDSLSANLILKTFTAKYIKGDCEYYGNI